MRENRLHGSEGGEGESPFRPLSTGAMSPIGRFVLALRVSMQPGSDNAECD